MAFVSSAELLVLHGVRIQGMADTVSVARRFSLDRVTVEELLLDHQARGWVRRAGFAGVTGWSLTEAGRREGSRMLAAELDEAGVHDIVVESHTSFSNLSAGFLTLITQWQIRPTPWDPMAENDHSEWRWDENILRSLAGLSQGVRPIGDQLNTLLRVRGLPGPVCRRAETGRPGRAKVGRRTEYRFLPHRLVRAPRGPTRHAWSGTLNLGPTRKSAVPVCGATRANRAWCSQGRANEPDP